MSSDDDGLFTYEKTPLDISDEEKSSESDEELFSGKKRKRNAKLKAKALKAGGSHATDADIVAARSSTCDSSSRRNRSSQFRAPEQLSDIQQQATQRWAEFHAAAEADSQNFDSDSADGGEDEYASEDDQSEEHHASVSEEDEALFTDDVSAGANSGPTSRPRRSLRRAAPHARRPKSTPQPKQTAAVPVPAATGGTTLTIRLRDGPEGAPARFKIKRTEPLQILMDGYCSKQKFSPASVLGFRFDGEVVNLQQTPDQLDLESDDLIDVVRQV
jgi:hypothetical protein